jgi:hypothetical protein
MNIRIVKRPRGEAPEEIRDAWIGVLLPIDRRYFPVRPRLVWGALSLRPRQTLQGYVVDTSAALNLLEKSNPVAAAWWRTNAPHLFKPEGNLLFDHGNFVFDEECCVIEE